MEKNNTDPPANNDIEILAEWSIKEFEQHEKSRRWYIIAITAALLLLLFSFLTANFLLAVIIIVTSLIYVLHEGHPPLVVRFAITDEGVFVGKKFYDYDDIKDFAIVYKPSRGIKNLYLNFHNIFQHRLSIPLEDRNPLHIREILLKYLSEDLEQTDPPISEQIAKILKL
jgi:hypothetical protein